MVEHVTPFLGTWILDPARSAYSGGRPPRSGRYTLSLNETRLDVSITGELASGDPIAVDYTLDLLADTLMAAGPVDRVRTVLEPNRLCTIAYAGATPVARAWRILGTPDELTIVQSAPDPADADGLWRDDVSVYRRA
jgi:hypothetical protein